MSIQRPLPCPYISTCLCKAPSLHIVDQMNSSRICFVIAAVLPADFEQGLAGGVGNKQTPKKNPKISPEMCPLLVRGHRKNGPEKRLESLAYEGFPCPPTPFQDF